MKVCHFLSSSSDSLAKTFVNVDFKMLEKEFLDRWEYLNKKLAYPYELFNSFNDYQKTVINLKKKTSAVSYKTRLLVMKK